MSEINDDDDDDDRVLHAVCLPQLRLKLCSAVHVRPIYTLHGTLYVVQVVVKRTVGLRYLAPTIHLGSFTSVFT